MTLGLKVAIEGDASGLGRELDAGGAKVTAFGKSVDVGGIAKLAAFGAVAGVVVTGLLALGDAAAQDRLESDQLAGAIAAAGAATGDWADSVDDAIAKGQDLAFSDTQIRDALTPLVGVTHDMTAARALLSEAEDIARLKHVDLATAAEAVAKAEGGQGTALAKLTEINAAGLTATQVLAAAQAKAAGQADIYGKSTKGAGEASAIGMSELGEKVGGLVLSLEEKLLPALLPIIDALSDLMSAVLPILIPIIETLGKVLGVVAGAISTVVKFVSSLLQGFADAAKAVGDFISSIDPLKAAGDFLGSVFGGGAGSGYAGLAGAGGGSWGAGGPGITGAGNSINITVTSADPEAVVRAVRRWAQLNGGLPAFVRKVDGA